MSQIIRQISIADMKLDAVRGHCLHFVIFPEASACDYVPISLSFDNPFEGFSILVSANIDSIEDPQLLQKREPLGLLCLQTLQIRLNPETIVRIVNNSVL